MSRRTIPITIQEEGRDHGKVFILTEMPAIPAEVWATQAMWLLVEAGMKVSEDEQAAGMEGLDSVRATAALDPIESMRFARALQSPTLDAWWGCVQYQHKPGQAPMPIDRGENCPIEEIKTVAFLRMQVLTLHTDFFSLEGASTGESPSPATLTGSRPTRMSRQR